MVGYNRFMGNLENGIKIFYGDDRVAAKKAINVWLGSDYEIFEGENLEKGDLQSLFFGRSIFVEKRRILVRDLGEVWYGELLKYVSTPHRVVILESRLDAKKKSVKDLMGKILVQKFELKMGVEEKKIFEIFDLAMRNPIMAVKLAEEIREREDAYRLFGLIAAKMITRYQNSGSKKDEERLKMLAKVDIEMKTNTAVGAWELVLSAIARL